MAAAKVLSVDPLPGYKIQVTFDDGVSGIIDLESFIKKGIFSSLKDAENFNRVYNTGYSIAWSDELEIDALSIYAEVLNRQPEDFLIANLTNATN